MFPKLKLNLGRIAALLITLSFITVLFVGMPTIAKATPLISPSGDDLSTWDYRVSVSIPADETINDTNYQVPFYITNGVGTNTIESIGNINTIHIYTNGHANPDFSDLRFIASNGTMEYDHYVELPAENLSTSCFVWVNVPSMAYENNIDVYYGQQVAASLSDGSATFEAFEDFTSNPFKKYPNVFKPTNHGQSEPSMIVDTNPIIFTGESEVIKFWTCDNRAGYEAVYYAESTDGFHFTEYPTKVIDVHAALDHWLRTFVMKDRYTNTYYLFGSTGSALYRWTSINGISWSNMVQVMSLGGAAWESIDIGNVCVWTEGSNNWKMIYEARGGVYNLGLATSTDGVVWTKYGGNPVLTGIDGGGPEVTKLGSRYHMFFHGGQSISLPTDGCYAWSDDLINWNFQENGPVIYPREAAWEGPGIAEAQISDPLILEFKGRTWYYYVAFQVQWPQTDPYDYYLNLGLAQMTLSELVNSTIYTPYSATGKWNGSGTGAVAYSYQSAKLTSTNGNWYEIHSETTFGLNTSVRAFANIAYTSQAANAAIFGVGMVGNERYLGICKTGAPLYQITGNSGNASTNLYNGPAIWEIGITPTKIYASKNNAYIANSPLSSTNEDEEYFVKVAQASSYGSNTLQIMEVRKFFDIAPSLGEVSAEILMNGEQPSESEWEPSITSTPQLTATVNGTYSYILEANETVTWTMATDASWLTLVGSNLSGIPDTIGTYNVTITATNSQGHTDTQTFTIQVMQSSTDMLDAWLPLIFFLIILSALFSMTMGFVGKRKG